MQISVSSFTSVLKKKVLYILDISGVKMQDKLKG